MSEPAAQQALHDISQWTEAAGLKLHPTKTRIVDASQAGGFDFLGYHFERGMKWPRQKSLKKFKDAVRQKTGRTRSGSMNQIIAECNRTLRGWFNYFKHGIPNVFQNLDGWTRGRLRSILRKRHKGKGRGRGVDHQKWPNAYFDELGLISLALARAKVANARF